MAKTVLNLLLAFAIWVAVLFMVALAGGVGTVELAIWTIGLPIVLTIVYLRSRRPDRTASS